MLKEKDIKNIHDYEIFALINARKLLVSFSILDLLKFNEIKNFDEYIL